MKKVVVVGAGLGGLVAAGLLAARGYQVVVFERAPIAGGRAFVWKPDGFTMSYGAHAVLVPRVEPMKSILRELQIQLVYEKASLSRFKLYTDGRLVDSPFGPGALTTRAMPDLFHRLVFFRKFIELIRTKPSFPPDFTVQDWLDAQKVHPSIIKVLRAYASLAVYDLAFDVFPMNAFVDYQKMVYSTSEPYVYMSYEHLLDQLQAAVTRNGGTILFRHEVSDLAVEGGAVKGVLSQGRLEPADAVILSLPPHALAKLCSDADLRTELQPYLQQRGSHAYVHDLMLSRELRRDVTNVLDLDHGVYINDLSLNIPSSAPEGAQLLNCLRFLSKEEQQDDAHAERSKLHLEGVLDQVYPGWRSFVIRERIIKRALVNGIGRRVGGQPLPLASRSVRHLYFSGDSTAGRGGLGVPAYDSAWRVASLIGGGK